MSEPMSVCMWQDMFMLFMLVPKSAILAIIILSLSSLTMMFSVPDENSLSYEYDNLLLM